MRLDIAVSQKFEISREKAKKLILSGNVYIGGTHQTVPRTQITDLSCIEVRNLIPEHDNVIKPNYEVPLDIIFEDDSIIVINKQKNLIIHEGNSENYNTVVNALIARYGKDFINIGSSFRPGIVHRLDKDTTGLMVIAKTQKAYDALSKMIFQHQIVRKYLAICIGELAVRGGKISINIGTDPQNKTRQKALSHGGREAITHYRVIKSIKNLSLVECTLETGRTHQIRVHMAYIKHPILGDTIYGRPHVNTIYCAQSQCLHAYKLEFYHPITKEFVSLENDPWFSLESIAKTSE